MKKLIFLIIFISFNASSFERKIYKVLGYEKPFAQYAPDLIISSYCLNDDQECIASDALKRKYSKEIMNFNYSYGVELGGHICEGVFQADIVLAQRKGSRDELSVCRFKDQSYVSLAYLYKVWKEQNPSQAKVTPLPKLAPKKK